MKIIFLGDVMGEPGVRSVRAFLPGWRSRYSADCVIANGENMVDGAGINRVYADYLFTSGVDVVTNGNHVWDKAQAWALLAEDHRLLRPHNFPPGSPGSGWCVQTLANGTAMGVLNILGNAFMHPIVGCPFQFADSALDAKPPGLAVVVVDFHAETTMEKAAMGWYLDGRVSAVLGTHTHVPTADERVLPGGTAYISDVGMCGCYDSVIGLDIEAALTRFISKRPAPFSVAAGRASLCGVLVDIDESTGKARSIVRLREDE